MYSSRASSLEGTGRGNPEKGFVKPSMGIDGVTSQSRGAGTRVLMVRLMKECLCLKRVRDVSIQVTEGPGG